MQATPNQLIIGNFCTAKLLCSNHSFLKSQKSDVITEKSVWLLIFLGRNLRQMVQIRKNVVLDLGKKK